MANKHKVLIIDDSPLVRKLLTEIINSSDNLEVVGTAADPIIARDKIKELNPDVLTLDIEMPRMDGITFLRNLMRLRPMPVVMISTLTEKGAALTLEALELGAIDYLPKPKVDQANNINELAEDIIEKVSTAASAQVRQLDPDYVVKTKPIQMPSIGIPKVGHIIAIGASTGGTEAIKEVLVQIPPESPPIVLAQHIPESFSSSFAARLNDCCAITVYEATHNQIVEQGCAYLAPGDQHLTLQKAGNGYVCKLNKNEKVSRHRPSVTVLFESVANQCKGNATGAILTGMGGDGAAGLLLMKQAGCTTLGQDKKTCVVYGMPKVAEELGAVDEQVPLNRIAARLLHHATSHAKKSDN